MCVDKLGVVAEGKLRGAITRNYTRESGWGRRKGKRGKERTRVLCSLSVRSAGLRNSASLVFADFKMFIFLHQFLKVQQACLVVIYFQNLK